MKLKLANGEVRELLFGSALVGSRVVSVEFDSEDFYRMARDDHGTYIRDYLLTSLACRFGPHQKKILDAFVWEKK